jgi:hypothetical protein
MWGVTHEANNLTSGNIQKTPDYLRWMGNEFPWIIRNLRQSVKEICK